MLQAYEMLMAFMLHCCRLLCYVISEVLGQLQN